MGKTYLLKLNNDSQTSSKRFVETSSISLFWCLSYVPFLCFLRYSLNYAIAHAQIGLLCLSELVITVWHENTRKLSNRLKQARKSISNSSNL